MAELKNDLTRFLEAQNKLYLKALTEISKGKKKPIGCGLYFPN